MLRPCFLVVDQEYFGNISTRKLVLETAKINVITAYSGAEAIAMLKRFPAVDGVVLDARVADMPCPGIVAAIKHLQPALPIIVVKSPRSLVCEADFVLDGFDPRQLLSLIESLYPEATGEAAQHKQV